MTEQEAIELLQNLNVKLTDMSGHKTNGIEKIFGWNEITAICEAIKALEEVQQYREIGTVSELQDLVIGINALADSQFSAADMEKLVNDMKSLYEYRQIGTLDECRQDVEKQKTKKIVRVKLRQSEWGSEYRCPVCESDLIKTVFSNEDGTEPDEKISWCSGCGQKLDWSDEE